MLSNSGAWFIRAGQEDVFEESNFANSEVAIGWKMAGDLSGCTTTSDITKVLKSAYSNVSHSTLNSYAVQLHVFRSVMRIGDIVVLLRSKAPDLAIGRVIGDYKFQHDSLRSRHVRAVEWLVKSVRRSEIPDLVDPPSLSVIYRISQGTAQVQQLVGAPSATEPAAQEPEEATALPTTGAYTNLSRNLNYARNLTSAGSHLEQLQVNLFEVTDVYRAAWVQAVAGLDHWVHQEIYDRMLALTEIPTATKPDGYAKFELPLGVVEKVQRGQQTLRDAVKDAMQVNFAYKTYQNPDKIREGLAHVADVRNLWARVATVLSEQAPGNTLSGKQVEQRLRDIVQRRNKIAHEYDEDPAKPPAKRHIDVGTTMETIDWLDQLALALLVVLDQE